MMKKWLLTPLAALTFTGATIAQDTAPAAEPEPAIQPGPTAQPEPASEAEPMAADTAPGEAAHTEGLLPKVAADGCELHLWPAERMSSTTTGLLGGGLLDAAIHANRDSSNQALMASALDSPSQLDALQQLDLRTLLSLTPGTTIIRHETPLERKTMNKVKTRRSDSTAACYGELIVADVAYQKAAIYGRSLRTLFMYRKFDSQQHIVKEYKAWGGNGLKLFPPKEGEDAIAALDELAGVYQKNFEEYAANARRSLASAAR
jgi:hypothetical protein